MGGLEDSVALGGLCNDELLLGGRDPDHSQSSRSRLERGWSRIVPDLSKDTADDELQRRSVGHSTLRMSGPAKTLTFSLGRGGMLNERAIALRSACNERVDVVW